MELWKNTSSMDCDLARGVHSTIHGMVFIQLLLGQHHRYLFIRHWKVVENNKSLYRTEPAVLSISPTRLIVHDVNTFQAVTVGTKEACEKQQQTEK